jgi:hypothetical protein
MRSKSHCVFLTVFAVFLISFCAASIAFAEEPAGLISEKMVEFGHLSSGAMITGVAGSSEEQAEPSREPGKKNPDQEQPDEVQKLKEQIIQLQNKGTLGFGKIVPCSSVEGFGMYSPLTPGESVPKLAFYCEPSNVSTLLSGDRYVIDCTVDVLLVDSTGKALLGKQNVVKINRVSRSPQLDIFFRIEINVQKLAMKNVMVKIVLHDKIKNQSVSTTQKIGLEGGPKKINDI